MINWFMMWLWLRFEFIIDWGGGGNTVIDWLPSICTTVSLPDENGYKLRSLSFHFLIFGVTISYYYPALFKFNELGEVIGKNLFPECSVVQMD